MSPRQQVAIKSPYDSFTDKGMTMQHQKNIGKFCSILAIDIRPCEVEPGFEDRYEWHASVALDSNLVTLDGSKPMLPFVWLILWNEDAWRVGIQHCREMLNNVGEGKGYWMGGTVSLHYRKPLTQYEMDMVLEHMK